MFNTRNVKFRKLSQLIIRSTTLDDFWDAMQTVYDVIKIPSMEKFNIKEKLDSWTRQKHYPVLKVREHDSLYLNISVANIDSLELNMNWWIPLSIVRETDLDFISQWQTIPRHERWITLLGNTKLFLPRQLNEWIIVNLQQTGKYC